MSATGTRRRDQRRVHRMADSWYTACAMRLSITWVAADIDQTPPADRCKRCWPTDPTTTTQQGDQPT